MTYTLTIRDYLKVWHSLQGEVFGLAQTLPDDGQLICCDVSSEWTDIGRRYWQRAGVAQRIDLRIGEALATLDDLLVDRRLQKRGW